MNAEIFKKYPELKELIDILLYEVRLEISQCQRPPSEIILDDFDVRQLLKISPRKLAYLKERKEISFSKPDGKAYYFLNDVIVYCSKNKIESPQKSPRFLRERAIRKR